MFRVGFGYDVHSLEEGRELWLGGIQIPYEKGLSGHSDADVLLHAVCDALLGAANLRDIGFHFSNQDIAYKNIDSKILLQKSYTLVQNKGYILGNIDCTLVAEEPKINPYIPQMQKVIAEILAVDPDCISIKATTNEKIGFVGRKEGMCAYATALIIQK